MNNKYIQLILLALLLLAGIGGSVWTMRQQAGFLVEIRQNGEVIYQFDLAREPDKTLMVIYQGRTNLIEIHDKQIRILQADCPDQTCVHTGWLQPGGLPIVCLPNRLVIKFVDLENQNDAVV